MSDSNDHVAETLRAWDLAAGKYADTIDADVAALLAGALGLSPPERDVLLPLVDESTRLLHLQCSHGQTALGLWRATGCEVVGLDGSAAMLAIAREKSLRLEAPSERVRFVKADVLAPPSELAGWATVLLTSSGALPWVRERFSPTGAPVPHAWEHQWALGQVVTAVAAAGLRIERLVEYAAHFWPQFPSVPQEELARLPHSFLLVARHGSEPRPTAIDADTSAECTDAPL